MSTEPNVPIDICDDFGRQRLPRWQELPDLDLYMDQVLSLIGRYLGAYPSFQDKGLTAAMVNNYVKQGVLPPPTKKKYSRSHIARLIILCLLKPSLPIPVIRLLMDSELETAPEEATYDHFCALFEETTRSAAESAQNLLASSDQQSGPLSAIYLSALRAQAEQALALQLFGAIFPKAK